MTEGGGSRKAGKSGRPKVVKKSEVGNPKSVQKDSYGEEENTSLPAGQAGEIEHPTSEIKEMEVHHHPDLHHAPKPWKEYLLEGLMIFLAVTMGFFAESIRENITDSSKENEYILSMIQDAKIDTAKIQMVLKLNSKRILALDSAASLCYYYDGTGSSDGEIYRQFGQAVYYPDFVYLTERTMSQLKNAGGMRLIRKKAAVDSIILYDDFSKKLLTQQEAYGTYLGGLEELLVKMLNYGYYFQTPGANHKSATYASAKLIKSDKATMFELANRAKIFEGVVAVYVARLNEENGHAVSLIKTLKKEYKLADE